MNMSDPSATSSGSQTHPMPDMKPHTSMSTIGMSGMASTFSTDTRVTLWFPGWTTTTTTTYVLAVFLLFFLGIFNRFLGALKSQLERRWKLQREVGTIFPSRVYTKKTIDSSIKGHARKWSHVLRAQPPKLEELDKEEIEPLTPASARSLEAEEMDAKATSNTSHRFWVAQAPWNINRDGISAGLEFARALTGYVLCVLCLRRNILVCILTIT